MITLFLDIVSDIKIHRKILDIFPAINPQRYLSVKLIDPVVFRNSIFLPL